MVVNVSPQYWQAEPMYRVQADIACSLRAAIHEFRKWNKDIK